MSTRSRLGHNVCSIIDNFIFHDFYQKVLTELLHVTSDIHYLFLIDDDEDDTTSIIVCKTCNYYWTWSDPDGILMCRHCFGKIPKGVELDNKKFYPYYSQINNTL